MSHFRPFEVVERGSETQIQVGDNLNRTTRLENDKLDDNKADWNPNKDDPVISWFYILNKK